MGHVDPARLVFIDEAGSHVAMTPRFARAPVGERAGDAIPRNRGAVLTMIGALDVDGVRAMMTIEGGTSGDVFVTFVEHVLCPELNEGDLVVMDNLGAHKDRRVKPLIEAVGARAVFLPPYSPDLNPIELTWSQIKTFLRKAKARCEESLNNALAMAMDMVRPSDARNWFRHCGYDAIQAN